MKTPDDSTPPSGRPGDITVLLRRMTRGDENAAGELFTRIYDVLRSQARAAMRRQSRSHTLQATDLVNEAFLKLVKNAAQWQDRIHFLSVAAKAMRSILVDHARAKRRRKRHPGGRRAALHELDEILVAFEDSSGDLLELDEALRRLATVNPRAARIVELRFFGGLSLSDTARLLELSLSTVERDWKFARAWLHAELS